MKKEIREVDEKRGILRVTTSDERWYIRQERDAKTGLPRHVFVPSVTWICEHYPKGVAFYKWLASKGWDEAEAIKSAAGDRGSRVHIAVAMLLAGQEVKIDSHFATNSDEDPKELSLEEYQAIMSFADWFNDTKPKVLGSEFAVWGDGYAGTVDLFCEIGGEEYIVDYKTSQYIWPSHELQLSAYKKAYGSSCKLAILQLGYRLNKRRFKFTEIEDQYQEFLAAKVIWAKEQKGVSPRQAEYPLSIRLDQIEKGDKTHEATEAR